MTSQSLKSLSDWLSYIDNIHSQTIELGLARVAKVAEASGLKHPAKKVILLGGTNGKGTTSRFIEQYLLSQGFSVGVFNSPYIEEYRELVRVNGQLLDDTEHLASFVAIEEVRADVPLSPFEFTTLAACYCIQQHTLDVALIEVGMGGKGDATNILDADISLITTIAMDHQAWLGDSREAIAAEKAGIFRTGKPAIVGESLIPHTLFDVAEQVQPFLSVQGKEFAYQQSKDSWSWRGRKNSFDNLPIPTIPMQNVSTALATLEALEIELVAEQVSTLIADFEMEGRFQRIFNKPDVYLDVAHNPEAAAFLATSISRIKQKRTVNNVHAVIGMLKDKDITQSLSMVCSQLNCLYLAPIDSTERGASADMLLAAYEQLPEPQKQSIASVDICHSVTQGLDDVLSVATPNDVVIVFGSFYTINDAMKYFRQKESN